MLLDTHVLLWLTITPKRLSKAAIKKITEHTNKNEGRLLVAAASFWEIAIKIEKAN